RGWSRCPAASRCLRLTTTMAGRSNNQPKRLIKLSSRRYVERAVGADLAAQDRRADCTVAKHLEPGESKERKAQGAEGPDSPCHYAADRAGVGQVKPLENGLSGAPEEMNKRSRNSQACASHSPNSSENAHPAAGQSMISRDGGAGARKRLAASCCE